MIQVNVKIPKRASTTLKSVILMLDETQIGSFKGKTGNIELSFVDSQIYVAIPYRDNLFEANISSPITSYSKLESYHYHLQLVAGLVEELNLNNRIWTKE